MIDRIGQLFIAGFDGQEPSKEFLDFLATDNIGGVILFEKSCTPHNRAEEIVRKVILSTGEVPFIAVDQEGGRVCRFKGAPAEYSSPEDFGRENRLELFEEHFVLDDIDEDELSDEEKEKHAKGEYPFDEPRGTTLIRISQDKELWEKWLKDNQKQFEKPGRYRLGKPVTPTVLIECLMLERFPKTLRGYIYEELCIRYKMDIPFEADMFVCDQAPAIKKMNEWAQKMGSRFIPGQWYFNGNVV